jgi:hypothetical protein
VRYYLILLSQEVQQSCSFWKDHLFFMKFYNCIYVWMLSCCGSFCSLMNAHLAKIRLLMPRSGITVWTVVKFCVWTAPATTLYWRILGTSPLSAYVPTVTSSGRQPTHLLFRMQQPQRAEATSWWQSPITPTSLQIWTGLTVVHFRAGIYSAGAAGKLG